VTGSQATAAVSRRGLLRLGGAAGLLGLGVLTAGCDLGPGSSSTPSAVVTPDPDEHIVVAARAELRGLIARLSATTGTSALVGRHQAQLAALHGDAPPTTQRSRGLTPAEVVTHERRAADRFTHWALTCQNGDLARVLAAVAAGIRMQPVTGGSS
jgi:hypothetical protein